MKKLSKPFIEKTFDMIPGLNKSHMIPCILSKAVREIEKFNIVGGNTCVMSMHRTSVPGGVVILRPEFRKIPVGWF
jgi:hypothetical protein